MNITYALKESKMRFINIQKKIWNILLRIAMERQTGGQTDRKTDRHQIVVVRVLIKIALKSPNSYKWMGKKMLQLTKVRLKKETITIHSQ